VNGGVEVGHKQRAEARTQNRQRGVTESCLCATADRRSLVLDISGGLRHGAATGVKSTVRQRVGREIRGGAVTASECRGQQPVAVGRTQKQGIRHWQHQRGSQGRVDRGSRLPRLVCFAFLDGYSGHLSRRRAEGRQATSRWHPACETRRGGSEPLPGHSKEETG